MPGTCWSSSRRLTNNDENVTIIDAAIAIKGRLGRVQLKQTKDIGFVKGGLGGGAVGVIAGARLAYGRLLLAPP